jgi:hypothetical protein
MSKAQPCSLIIHNLDKGWYLRSTGIWTFDLEQQHYPDRPGCGQGLEVRQQYSQRLPRTAVDRRA